MSSPRAAILVSAVALRCGVFALGAAVADAGWTGANPARRMPSPVRELWRAPVEKGASAFRVDWRDGSAGKFSVENGALRIEKTNDVGRVVVTAEAFAVPVGSAVQGFAACSVVGGVDPLEALGYIRLFGAKENLKWDRSLFAATSAESPLFSQLVNSPPGGFVRKLCRARADGSGRLAPAIVVEGPASVTEWRDWGAEDAAAADAAWKAANSRLKAPDRSGTLAPDSEFDMALAADSDHSARLVAEGGFAWLEVDGRVVPPVLYKPIPFGMGVPFTGEGRAFEKAGVDLQVVNVRFGVGGGRIGFWSKDGFDVVGAVRRVREAMRAAPGSLFFLTIRCDAYPEYAAEHPSEIWQRIDGSPVYGSCSQGEKNPSASPPKGKWTWVSNHSLVWRADVKRHMSSFVAALKSAGLAKRIIGVHLAGYHDGQFAVPVADFSAPAVAAFRRWQERRFGKVKWQEAPRFASSAEFLDPVSEAAEVEYQRFVKWGPMEMQEDFARHLKREFGKPVVCGRWCMTPLGGSVMSTLDFTPFVRSDALDFLVAQPAYSRRAPGVACGIRIPLASFRAHGKLFLNEFDLRTWHGRGGEGEARSTYLSRSADLPEWETVHRKLAGQMMANRMGWWYFDMCDNWFDEPSILADIASVRRQADKSCTTPAVRWKPSAAFVVDEEGLLLRNRIGHGLSMREVANTAEQLQTLSSSGVPFDVVLAQDLLDAPSLADGYRLLVMGGFYGIDKSRASLLADLRRRGIKLVFLADAGALGGSAACAGSLCIAEPGGLSPQLFRKVVAAAGGYVPTRSGLQVDMNGNFMSMHCLESGHYDFALPRPCIAVNLKTGRRERGPLSLDLVGGETRWYALED